MRTTGGLLILVACGGGGGSADTTTTGTSHDSRWHDDCVSGREPKACRQLGDALADTDRPAAARYYDLGCVTHNDGATCYSAAATYHFTWRDPAAALRYAARACELETDQCLLASQLAREAGDPAAAAHHAEAYRAFTHVTTDEEYRQRGLIVDNTIGGGASAPPDSERPDLSTFSDGCGQPLLARWRDTDPLKQAGYADNNFSSTLSHIARNCYDADDRFNDEVCGEAVKACKAEGAALEANAAAHDTSAFLADIQSGWNGAPYTPQRADLFTTIDGTWNCQASSSQLMATYADNRAAIFNQHFATAWEWQDWYRWAAVTCTDQAKK